MIRLALLSLCAATATAASAATYSVNPVVTAPAPTQFYVYKEDPAGTIVLDNTYPVVSALQGTAAAPGGNVELFATGDADPLYQDPASGQPFSTVPLVTLTGTANSAPFVLSSLNGATWFTTTGGSYNTTYGALNLANTWFNGLVDTIIPRLGNPILGNLVNTNRASIFDGFRNAGGFTELSDPNIAYLFEEAGEFHIGLAGFLDQSPRLRQLLPDFAALIPNGIQWSEVVMVNGVPLYSFAATPSGVVMNDNFGSFNANYALRAPAPQIPEPTAAALLLLPAAVLFRRRR
jgi:hypothetical protein